MKHRILDNIMTEEVKMQSTYFKRLWMLTVVAGLLGLAAHSSYIFSQSSSTDLDKALVSIKPELIKSHVKFLSHDLLRGRGTGDVGYEIAREYVAAQFMRLGLKPIDGPSYLQPFDIFAGGKDLGSELIIASITLKSPEVTFTPAWLETRQMISGEGIYVGYGLITKDRDDYAGIDAKGKIVFISMGMPPDMPEGYDKVVLTRAKMELAVQRGARAVVALMEAGQSRTSRSAAQAPMTPEEMSTISSRFASRQELREGGGGAPLKALIDGGGPARPDVTVGPEASQRLLTAWGVDPSPAKSGTRKRSASRSVGKMTLKRSHEISQMRSWNVIGVAPGFDPILKTEAVVFVAHLDHIGIGKPDEAGDSIFNGAHDNAMGISKMLATAEAISQLRPRRSVVFAALGSEEGGVLGSSHYVRHPIFPLEQTVAVINQDGGREGAPSEDVVTFGNQFSSVLDESLRKAAKETGMSVSADQRPPLAPGALFSSDHYPFMVAGIPAVYLMDGYTVGGDPDRGHKEWLNYVANFRHKQSDNFQDEWSFESPARMATLTARLVWILANQDQRPQMNPDSPAILRPR